MAKATLSILILSGAAVAVIACGAFGTAESEPTNAPADAASDSAAPQDVATDAANRTDASPLCSGSTTFGGDMSALPEGFAASLAPDSPPSFSAGQMVAAASMAPSSYGKSTITRFFEGPVSSADVSWTATLPSSSIQAEVGCRLHLTVVPSNETIRLYFVHNGLTSLEFIADRLSSPAVGVDQATLAAPHGPGTFAMTLGARHSNGTLSLRASFNGKAHNANVPLAETIQRAEVNCGVYSAYNGSGAPDIFTVRVDDLSGTVCPVQ